MYKPVSIEYSTGGDTKPELFDFVVIACDPRGLNFSNRSPLEQNVSDKLTSNTFYTTLSKVNRPNRDEIYVPDISPSPGLVVNFAVRFHPGILERMDGHVYGFRDEVMARDDNFLPDQSAKTWTVTYQIEDMPLIDRDDAEVKQELDDKRKQDLGRCTLDPPYPLSTKYLDFDPDGCTLNSGTVPVENDYVLVDYFPHFQADGLQEELPWSIISQQGNNHTLYVASFACFESVLHCFNYQNRLMENPRVIEKFPQNKDAKIAVIGAGPAGLLFASQHLQKKGYTNYTVFEKDIRFGGKTKTVCRRAPSDPSARVLCELGTCYLSPAYFPLYELFAEYNAGQVVALDRGSRKFRSVVEADTSISDTQQEQEDGVSYYDWIWEKVSPHKIIGMVKIFIATVKYIIMHYIVMDMSPYDALPESPPSAEQVSKNIDQLFSKYFKLTKTPSGDQGEKISLLDLFKVILNHTVLKRRVFQGLAEPKIMALAKFVDQFEQNPAIRRILEQDENMLLVTKCSLQIDGINVYTTSFEDYLTQLEMEALIPTLIYAYQVQGYGALVSC